MRRLGVRATVFAVLICLTLALARPALAATGYVVRHGDTLYKIATTHGVSVAELMKDNRLRGTTIYPGQKLWIRGAAGFLYQVRRGDTLYRIAQRTGTTVSLLRQVNRLRHLTIYPGQKLWIPKRRGNVSDRSFVPRLSADEIYLFARLVYAEARGEPYVGQVAVAAVVLNRLQDPRFPKTLYHIVFQPGAFTAVTDGQINLHPNTSAFRAVREALAGWDPTGGALYYWNPYKATNKWIWSRPIVARYGNHVFAL